MYGVSLLLRHPRVASRDCRDCMAHVYNEETGRRELFHGEPVKRTKRRGPPCMTDTGCPKGTHSNPVELSEKNEQAYQHYRTCKAVGRFPQDPIVERNARIIRSIEDSVESEEREGFFKSALMLSRVGRV